MKTETVEIAYAAEVTYMAGKSRTPKRHFVPGAFAIDVPHLDPAEVRDVASGWFLKGSQKEPVRVVGHGGRTLSAFRTEARSEPVLGLPALDGFKERMSAPSRNGFYLFGHMDPWPRGKDGIPLPADVKTITQDGRGEMEAMVRAEVEGLSIHDGIVLSDRAEPVINFAPSGMDVHAGISAGPELRGYSFRLDRLAVAREALASMCRTGGYKDAGADLDGLLDNVTVHHPEGLGFREDVHNARVAANMALGHLGGSLGWMPADLFPMLHELALARDGLATGSSEPDEVSAILGRFEDARDRIGGRLVQLKHVLAIGRDMIAMSLRSERTARLDAADAEAISAFAPR
jgi:hypothetical protein